MKHGNRTECPLLLTGTIDPSVFNNNHVVLTDANERLAQYSEVITRFLSDSPFDPVVFAENSGHPFPAYEFRLLAEQHHKQFEYLYVETSVAKTDEYGKSYGEAVLLTQAAEKSELLKQRDYFYKITGRVYLENAEKICRSAENGKSEFLTIRDRDACQTVFFKLQRKDYDLALTGLPERCDEKNGIDIEHAVYELLHENGVSYGCFSAYPALHGICGTDGLPYDRSAKNMWIKNRMIRLGLFRDGKLNYLQREAHRALSRVKQNWFW